MVQHQPSLVLRARSDRYTLLALLMVAAFGLLSFRVGQPWLTHQDENGAWISQAIRNYQRYGFLQLGGIVYNNSAPTLPESPMPYVHHPPLAVWMYAAPVLLTGAYHEALLRMVSIACTLLSAALLYATTRRLFNRSVALWTLILYLFTPMMLYFGRMPDHEAPGLLFLTAFAFVGVRWLQENRRRDLLLLLLFTILLAWTAWGALITAGGLTLGWLVATRDRKRLQLLSVAIAAIFGVSSVLALYTAYIPDTLTRLQNVFAWRSSSQSFLPDSAVFTPGDYALRVLVRLFTLFSFPVLPLVVVGYAWVMTRRHLGTWTLFGGTFGAVTFLLLFRNASYIHDYYQLYLMPWLALAGGVGLITLCQAGATTRKRRVWRRFARPLVAALLIFVVPVIGINLARLHFQDQRLPLIRAPQFVTRNTSPDDLIVSPLASVPTSFYIERELIPGDTANAVQTTARVNTEATAETRVFYLTCAGFPQLASSQPRRNTVASSSGCTMIQMK